MGCLCHFKRLKLFRLGSFEVESSAGKRAWQNQSCPLVYRNSDLISRFRNFWNCVAAVFCFSHEILFVPAVSPDVPLLLMRFPAEYNSLCIFICRHAGMEIPT